MGVESLGHLAKVPTLPLPQPPTHPQDRPRKILLLLVPTCVFIKNVCARFGFWKWEMMFYSSFGEMTGSSGYFLALQGNWHFQLFQVFLCWDINFEAYSKWIKAQAYWDCPSQPINDRILFFDLYFQSNPHWRGSMNEFILQFIDSTMFADLGKCLNL